MGSDDFISIEPIIGSNEEDDGHNASASGEDGEIKEGEHEQDMDLESDPETFFVKEKNLLENVNTEEAHKTTQLEKILESEVGIHNQVDGGFIRGVKRARTTNEDQQPCVHVSYKSLTKESKKKLIELMQQWSRWHAESISCNVSSEEKLECGTETFFPALHVGSEKASVSFWVDAQARNEDVESIQLDNDSVPLYDRGYTLGSTSHSGSADAERVENVEASRCFNCGSYSHSLKECPKPRDNAAVNSARKQHNANRKFTPPSLSYSRYYLEPKAKGKYHDLKPGVLGPETREALGIGKLDPPPWLNRMRQLGYPPGYLDVEGADKPSGITIFGEEEKEAKLEYEDGELPEKADPVPAEKKMTVLFPGINAPIPEDADRFLWETSAVSSRNWDYYDKSLVNNRYKDNQYKDHQYRDYGQPAPPGIEHGYTFSSRYNSSPYDLSNYNNSNGNNSNSPYGSHSASLSRSLSDRGWHGLADDFSGSRHRPSSSRNHDQDQRYNDRWYHRS